MSFSVGGWWGGRVKKYTGLKRKHKNQKIYIVVISKIASVIKK